MPPFILLFIPCTEVYFLKQNEIVHIKVESSTSFVYSQSPKGNSETINPFLCSFFIYLILFLFQVSCLRCHDDQKVLDACIEEKLHVTRPKMGYFSKLHVYDSKNPAPGTLFVIFFSVVFEDYIAHCTNEQISVHPFSFFLFFFRFTGCSKIT